MCIVAVADRFAINVLRTEEVRSSLVLAFKLFNKLENEFNWEKINSIYFPLTTLF